MADTMERRSFGGGVRVSVLGIGCGRVASISNPVPMREIEATLEAAVDAGINLFDTADIYGQGDSERTLARLLRRHRERMFVVTKVGGRHGRHAGLIRLAKPILRIAARSRASLRSAVVKARTATVVHDFSPADLRPAVDASRRRLALDRLDGLLLHSPSTDTLRKPEIHDFLDEVLRGGAAARVGASVDSFAALEAATAIPALTMIQAPLEVAAALPGTAALDRIRARNIGLFVREVLRRPDRAAQPASPRAALAAALAPDFVTAAIVGVSTRQHFRDLLSAAT
jgi:aryl-alcohol dehydrogenase-like predicted oxidoreductase